MQTVLFHSTIFGPIHSRRLGVSLGVNLLPVDGKICTFDCRYCEAGFNAQGPGNAGLPARAEVRRLLEEKLCEMKSQNQPLDVITFSGNGEPTIHPEFAGIIDDTIALRDKYFPQAGVSVLTNGTMVSKSEVAVALNRVDKNCVKIDSVLPDTVARLDRPTQPSYSVEDVIAYCEENFGNRCIVQTMMCRGDDFDNTTADEIDALCEAYTRISPNEVQLYSIDRQAPDHTLRRVPAEELRDIGAEIQRRTGIPVQTV